MTKTKDTTPLSVTLVIIKFATARGDQSERAEAFASREHAIRMLPEYVKWCSTSTTSLSTVLTLRVIRDAAAKATVMTTVTILTVTQEGARPLVLAFESQAQALAALPRHLADETRVVTLGLRTLDVISDPTEQP